MERIKEFLLDTNQSNLSVIVTSILSAIITTIIAICFKEMINIFKIICKKIKMWIKSNIIKLKRIDLNIVQKIKRNRKEFNDIVIEYNKNKNSYNFLVDGKIKKLKYLTKSQNEIRDKIINENKEKIQKEIEHIHNLASKMKYTVNLSMEEINKRFY